MPEDRGIKNENKTVGTEGEPSKTNNPRDAVSIFIPQTVIEEYRANVEQNRAFEKRRYRLEKLALLVAAIYAALTFGLWRNAKITADQEIMSNRPVMYHNGIDWLEKPPAGSLPKTFKVKINWKNFGRSLAVTVVPAAHIFVRPSKGVPPIDPDCHDGELPKTKRTDAVAPDERFGDEYQWGLADDEIMDIEGVKTGKKILYVSGCVYYWGIDRKQRYVSDLCVKWSATEPQDFPTCGETDRNTAY